MKITYFQRSENLGFSIERLFGDIRTEVSKSLDTHLYKTAFGGTNPIKLLWNGISSIGEQGDINHITGDIHYLALFLDRKRTILTIHDCVSLERLKGWKRYIHFLFWYKLPAKNAAIITVISESTKKQLQRYVKTQSEKIRVIHNCVSDSFKPSPKTFQSAPIILQIGTGPNKNLIRVCEALNGVACHLRIVGRLNQRHIEALKSNNIRYSNVTQLTDNEIVKEYQNCDMLIFASIYEGFGLPILEAQATGRPVLTSNIFSMPEIGGKGVCYVDPYSVPSISKGVSKIISDEMYRNQIIQNGFENVKKFSPNSISSQYIKLYKEILNNDCIQIRHNSERL